MHQVHFTTVVKKPQNLLPALLNLRTPTLSGSRAGVAPLWAIRNLAQALLSLLEPGILDTLQRESIFSGFYTCLQTLGMWLQSGVK